MSTLFRLLTLSVAMTGTAAAQSVTKGVIKGTVVDDGDLAIPGAMITITSPNLMGAREDQTDANGRFLFSELPPGVYELVVTRNNFVPVKKTRIQVNASANTIINIKLSRAEDGADDEMIIEESRAVIDTQSGDRGSVLTKDFLQRLPAGRSYQSAVQLAAGVTGGANANIGGASGDENTYMLDGVNITDPVTGTFSLNFNFDAIEQLQVITSAFDPEYGQNLGGVINLIPISGGNTFEFAQDVRYTNGEWGPKLDTTYAADGQQLAPTDFDRSFTTILVNTTVSGPIVRDKAWFAASYQLARSIIAQTGIDLPRDYEEHSIYAKITLQPTTAHRLSLLFQSDPTTIDNIDQTDRFVSPEAQGRQAQGGFVTTGQWDWFYSPEVFTETKFTVQKSWIETSSVPCTHNQDLGYHPCEPDELENTIDYTTAGRLGTNQAFDSGNRVFFNFDDRWRFVLGSKISLLQLEALGTHDVKVGINVDVLWRNQIFGANGNMYYNDINNLSFNPDTYTNWFWVEYSNPLSYSSFSNQLGLFVQDIYQPVPNLTFRYGTRYDRATFRNDVGEEIIDVGVFAPRLSIIWDPFSDARTAIKASVGRFNNPGRIGIASFLSQGDLGAKLILGEFFDDFTSDSSNVNTYSPIENTNFLHDKTTIPRSDEFLVGIEREVVRDLAVKTFFNGKFTRNLWTFDEVNLMWDADGYNLIGSSDGTFIPYSRLRTPDIGQRTYYRWDLIVEKVRSNRWEAQINYSFTSSRGTVLGTPSGFLAVPQQTEFYLNSFLGTDIRHDISAGVSWDVPNDPWTTRLGLLMFLESGYPITRVYSNGNVGGIGGSTIILKETVGSYARTVTWWDTSVQIQQAVPVRKGQLFGVASVDNITNWRSGQVAGLSFDNRWIVTQRQNPIRLTVGGRYEF
ncbi:MAG: TonB-dependent receptor [Myxococcota bacterium]